MPLSEQEQRLLDEMERSLYHNDADFVATVGSHNSRPNYRWIVIGILVGLVGIVGIIVGVASQIIAIGIFGFVIMFLGVLFSLKRSAVPNASHGGHSGTSHPRTGFMDRMNDRWDRRQDERGH
jgi:hypothetical protein